MRAASALLAVAMLALPNAAQAARPLELGFADSVFATPQRDPWLERAQAAGAGAVRLIVVWRAIAPAQPGPNFDARSPADPAYDFRTLDDSVRGASARGLRVILDVLAAPDWAEGPGRPARASPGSWRPDPGALGDFAHALATRYSGAFAGLPRVSDYQLWNEPNLPRYLSPQWQGRKPASPLQYRAMLNAFYAGVKGVDAADVVIAGATSPYGDGPGGSRMMPAMFARTLLCLGSSLRRSSCPGGRAHFDVYSHHPYEVSFPRSHALNADDVSIPDLGKLTRALAAAVAHRTVEPVRAKPLWITEISYDSNPPDPGGVPARLHARYMDEALYLFWKQGVSLVCWLQIVDAPPIPDYAGSVQAGLYLLDGTAKPALTAFRFPFFAERSGGTVLLWVRAPVSGSIVVERRTSTGWRAVARLHARRGAVLASRVKLTRRALLRARAADGELSLSQRS